MNAQIIQFPAGRRVQKRISVVLASDGMYWVHLDYLGLPRKSLHATHADAVRYARSMAMAGLGYIHDEAEGGAA